MERVLKRVPFTFEAGGQLELSFPLKQMDNPIETLQITLEVPDGNDDAQLIVSGLVGDSYVPIKLVNMNKLSSVSVGKESGLYMVIASTFEHILVEGDYVKGEVVVIGD